MTIPRLVLIVVLALAASDPLAADPLAADPVTRVAALLPFVADALEPAAGDAELVAAVRRDLDHPLPEGIIDLGSAHHPNYELLAVARADIVVGDHRLHGPMRDRLASFGGKVLLIDTGSVDGTLAGLEDLGARLGGQVELGLRVTETRHALADLRPAHPADVLLVFGVPGHFMCMTGDTWLGDLIHQLGLRNVVDASVGSARVPGYVTPSDEILASLVPDLVLVVSHGDPQALRRIIDEERSRKSAWGRLSERSTHRWHILDPDRFSTNPGLGLAEAGREIVRLLSRTRG